MLLNNAQKVNLFSTSFVYIVSTTCINSLKTLKVNKALLFRQLGTLLNNELYSIKSLILSLDRFCVTCGEKSQQIHGFFLLKTLSDSL